MLKIRSPEEILAIFLDTLPGGERKIEGGFGCGDGLRPEGQNRMKNFWKGLGFPKKPYLICTKF